MSNQNINHLRFKINLKNKPENAQVNHQDIIFLAHENAIIFSPGIGEAVYGFVSFTDEGTFLVLNKHSEEEFGEPDKQEVGLFHYKLDSVEIDSELNIQLTKSEKPGEKPIKIKFFANEVTFSTKGEKQQAIENQTSLIKLPTNFFELVSSKKITTNNLPVQFLNAAKNLGGTSTLEFEHKKKTFTIIKVNSQSDPLFYIVHKNKLIQFDTEDVFIHIPESQGQKGSFNITTNQKGTKGLGISALSKENAQKIADFIEQDNSKQVTKLTPEQYSTQILKPQNISAKITPLEKNALSLSSVRQLLKHQKQMQNQQHEVNFTPQTPETTHTPSQNEEERELDEMVKSVNNMNDLIGKPTEEDTTTNAGEEANVVEEAPQEEQANQTPQQDNQGSDGGGSSVDSQPPQDTNNIAEPSQQENSGGNTQTPPAEQAKQEKSEEPQTKTEDLSDLAKIFGIGLFLFGLFTGFGGLLLTIMAAGIGSSTLTFNKKFKKVKMFPKGAEHFNQQLKQAKVKDKIDLGKKSTYEKEAKFIDKFIDSGAISQELGNQIKQTISSFSQNASYVDKVEHSITSHLKKLDKLKEKLENRKSSLDYKGKPTEELQQKIQLLESGLSNLKFIKKEFDKYKLTAKSDLESLLKDMADYAMLSTKHKELKDKNLAERLEQADKEDDEIAEQLDQLLNTPQVSGYSEQDRQKKIDSLTAYKLRLYDYVTTLQDQKTELDITELKLKKLKESTLDLQHSKMSSQAMVENCKTLYSAFIRRANSLAEKINQGALSKSAQKKAKKIEQFTGFEM